MYFVVLFILIQTHIKQRIRCALLVEICPIVDAEANVFVEADGLRVLFVHGHFICTVMSGCVAYKETPYTLPTVVGTYEQHLYPVPFNANKGYGFIVIVHGHHQVAYCLNGLRNV